MIQNTSQIDAINETLQEVIEQLYQLFAVYPLNPNMNGSPLYSELVQWNQVLATKPLRKLSAEDLRIYYFKAITTWGEVNDFKHFLPRILELLSTLPSGFDEWVALDKLNYAGFKNWPQSESYIVVQFLSILWQKLLSERSGVIDAAFEDYFPAIANVYPDFNQLLRLWHESNNEQAYQRLAAFICRNDKAVLKKQILPGYLDMVHQGKLFFDWLHTQPVLDKLKQIVPSNSHPYLDMELIPIIKQLE